MTSGQRATIYSVADRAHVSIATVSRVFQGSARVADETRQRVLAAAASLDYQPDGAAKSLAAKSSNVLGLVLPELKGAYYSELLSGFEAAASEHGRSVMLLLGSERHAKRIRQLESRVDGIAVVNASGEFAAEVLDHVLRHMPLVTIAAPPPNGADGVATSCRPHAEALTSHLLGHGRRRLAFVGDPGAAFDARHRYIGFGRALAAAGCEVPAPIRAGFEAGEGTERLAGSLLSGETDADALVCVNDEVALELAHLLRRGGVRIGEDLAITGWDDVPAARLVQPGLTTVSQPVRELGRAAAIRLVERLAGGAGAVPTQLLSTTLVIRGSCGCAEEAGHVRPASAPLGNGPDRSTTH